MRHTLSKQETCKGAAAAMAESTTLKQASCSITLDSQYSMQLTTDESSACPDSNMSIWEACTFVTATSVAKSESIGDCTIHVESGQHEQLYMFQEVVTFVVKKFTRSKLLCSAFEAIMERYEVFVAILVILAVYLCGKFGDEFEIRKKRSEEVSTQEKETEEEEEEGEEQEEAEEETEEEEKQTKKEAKKSPGEAKGKKSEEPVKEKKKTASTSTASSSKKAPELEEEIVRLQALVDEKEQAITDLADDLLQVRNIVADKEKSFCDGSKSCLFRSYVVYCNVDSGIRVCTCTPLQRRMHGLLLLRSWHGPLNLCFASIPNMCSCRGACLLLLQFHSLDSNGSSKYGGPWMFLHGKF